MRRVALIGGLSGLSGVACDDCGLYQYKGVRTVEWCGDVYGSAGTLEEGSEDVASAEIIFRHAVPPGELYFDHSANLRARFLWADLESGEPFGAERVFSECRCTNFGDPLTDRDAVLVVAPAFALPFAARLLRRATRQGRRGRVTSPWRATSPARAAWSAGASPPTSRRLQSWRLCS